MMLLSSLDPFMGVGKEIYKFLVILLQQRRQVLQLQPSPSEENEVFIRPKFKNFSACGAYRHRRRIFLSEWLNFLAKNLKNFVKNIQYFARAFGARLFSCLKFDQMSGEVDRTILPPQPPIVKFEFFAQLQPRNINVM